MRSAFILILIVLAHSQVQLGAEEAVQVPCSAQGHMMYFKTMKEFSLVSIDKVDGVTLISEHSTCSFRAGVSSICTFENFTKQINVTCQSSQNQ